MRFQRTDGKDRPTYSVHALKRGDVVMVGAYIQRYRLSNKPKLTATEDNSTKPMWEARPWDQWKVKFQLKRLYVLYVGGNSGDAPGDVPDEDEEI